jgi:chromosome segregation ATPase
LYSTQVLRTTGQELDGDKVIHLSDPLQNFTHHQRLAEELGRTITSVDEMKGELTKRETDITGRIDNLEKQLEKKLVNHHVPREQPQSVDNGFALRLKQLETQDAHSQALIKALRKESHDLRAEMQALRREVQQLQRTGQPFTRHTSRDTQG